MAALQTPWYDKAVAKSKAMILQQAVAACGRCASDCSSKPLTRQN